MSDRCGRPSLLVKKMHHYGREILMLRMILLPDLRQAARGWRAAGLQPRSRSLVALAQLIGKGM
jgi:hypothetical protein